MQRTKHSVKLRNVLTSLAFDCEGLACYDGTFTSSERKYLSEELKKLVKYIDERIDI